MTSNGEATAPLSSVYTPVLPGVLKEIGMSLLVTTYQAGNLFVVRAKGDSINTQFREFARSMGVAIAGHRIA